MISSTTLTVLTIVAYLGIGLVVLRYRAWRWITWKVLPSFAKERYESFSQYYESEVDSFIAKTQVLLWPFTTIIWTVTAGACNYLVEAGWCIYSFYRYCKRDLKVS